MQLYKARVKTERELLASGWEREGTGNYRRAYVKMTNKYNLHITQSMADYCGDKIELKLNGQDTLDNNFTWFIDQRGIYWREDMLTNISELKETEPEETKNICLTLLEIEKVIACIESKITQYKGRFYYTDEYSAREANEAIEFYTQLANKFKV